MKKKSLVSKHDYDLYRMSLPFNVIRKRQRLHFVRSELEKRHPRFSEKCCADTRLSFRRGKLTAEVAVMDKVRLAEYKQHFPGKKLFLEEQPDRPVFRKQSGAGIITAVCCAALCAVGAKVWMNQHTPLPEPAAVETVVLGATAAVLLPSEKLFAQVLSAVNSHGGKISALTWQDGTCQFSVSGCYPEDVAAETACAVSYKNNEPRFELALSVQKTVQTDERASSMHFAPQLRRELLERGFVILSEQLTATEVTVHIFADTAAVGESLKLCAEIADRAGWHEKGLRVQGSETGCDVVATFGRGAVLYEELSPFETVAQYAPLFEPKTLVVPVRPRAVEPIAVAVRDKVGEIRRMDGTVFAYYKMGDGRIVCEQSR